VTEKEVVDILSQDGTEIVLTYAPAGLGHLRDMDALKDGIPKGVRSSILTSDDESIRLIHRLTSVNPLMRRIFEFMQSGRPQTVFTYFYRIFLRANVREVREQLQLFIKNKKPKRLIIVTTHFGFAHQVAAVKKELEKETGCKIYLIVQATDDSPQYIWYVDGADLEFVTSGYVKNGLAEYGRQRHLPTINMEINPTPLHPFLLMPLTSKEMINKKTQADAKSEVPINVVVPISGAAVGTHYIFDLMKKLHQKSDRFQFQVITKIAPYTKKFLRDLKGKDYIKVYASNKDKEVVDLYHQVIKTNVILLEITKPSEQAFKAALEPGTRGGVIMLFTTPVGRQEYENVDYLVRRDLMPPEAENKKMWAIALHQEKCPTDIPRLDAAIRIPDDPEEASEFIRCCLDKGLFAKMLLSSRKAKKEKYPDEINGEGVKMFWEKTARFLVSETDDHHY